MYVVMVASECAPAAKAGGLGDAVSGLSRELELRGHAVEIILPKYAGLQYSDIWGLQPTYHDLWVPWYGASSPLHGVVRLRKRAEMLFYRAAFGS